MKVILLISLIFVAASADEGKAVHPQTRASAFTYNAGSTAAYTPGTGLIYSAGTIVKYVGGTTVIFPYNTNVNFPSDVEFYVKAGPVSMIAGSNATFGSGTQVTFPPGTGVKYTSNNAEVQYQQFNGNTHTMAQYATTTSVQYYCSNCNLILFAPSTNPLVYYNPGGSTQFGSSGLPVEKDVTPASARTYGGSYGGSYGGGCGYSYCSGYSYQGYPSTTYNNYNTGYQSTCYQTCYNCYSYGGGGGSYGQSGGYSMAGGSCYGGGAYYGSYGGSYYG